MAVLLIATGIAVLAASYLLGPYTGAGGQPAAATDAPVPDEDGQRLVSSRDGSP